MNFDSTRIAIIGLGYVGLPVLGSKVLVLGLTFKENCPDLRNTKVVDMVRTLQGVKSILPMGAADGRL